MTMAIAPAPAQSARPNSPFLVLTDSDAARYVRSFDAGDDESIPTDIPNKDALAWLNQNVPRFDCPDKLVDRLWWFRWWCYRKHLKRTPDGWVVTEFLPNVSWAGKYNTIPCAAGHHFYEGRWLRDPQYMEDYARFWFLPGSNPRLYSFWAADSVRAVTLATGDDSLAIHLLPYLVANFEGWEKTNQDPNGLFRQIDDRDGMEYSLGGSGYRPSINSYMYGDAIAIGAIADEAGETGLGHEFREKAARIKRLVETYLWNRRDGFFETAPAAPDLAEVKTCGIREEIGFIPWYFNLPDEGYEQAWKQLEDPQGFAAPFGPTTAERRAAGFMHPEPHDCLWNGPSWPYATTQTLVAMANLMDNYHPSVVTKKDYMALLHGYVRSQQKDGKPWIAEDLDPDTGKWIVDLPRSVYYNHSGFADLVITGLVGLRPEQGNEVVLKPLLPQSIWQWFCLDGVPYHGHNLTVLWDKTGGRYRHGQGLSLFIDGKLAAHSAQIENITATLPSKPAAGARKAEWRPIPVSETTDTNPWIKYAGDPVLGGSLGTCFDISVLSEKGKYLMYFSWRPKQSIALTESADGIHWSDPVIVLAPAKTGWEDDMNRPSVVEHAGLYRMWYTGQANGHSEIGYATSKDGVHWDRLSNPVLTPEQPWEKVAVMCPSVLWDEHTHEFRMWYSGGEQYEPDAIGYATSPDGIHWTKHEGPIFQADPASHWESYKVTACQVLVWQGWYYMFYIGFRDIDHAQIGLARSKDGISGWQRLPSNPIISPTPGGWDSDACYKPFAIYDDAGKKWMLWYNGRSGQFEQIGLATKQGPGLGF